ncbi:MAG: FKBP-type peptidyl-prolyl cis-trans isomerase [Pseudomonadota bacterium]
MFSAHRLLCLVASWLLLAPLAVAAQEVESLSEEEEKNILAYSLGYNVAARMANDFPQLDLQAFKDGMQAAYDGDESQFPVEQMQRVVSKYQNIAAQRQKEALQNWAMENRRESTAFLQKNAKRVEVTQTKSGLQYEVMDEGDGLSPKPDSKVLVHYHGELLDGTVFDSSIDRDKPVELDMAKVIGGWREGLQLMRRGGKFKFYIPPELAYGAEGGGAVGPNEVLIFEVELLEVRN